MERVFFLTKQVLKLNASVNSFRVGTAMSVERSRGRMGARPNSGTFSIFHHFPIKSRFVVDKCRRPSNLSFTRGSLGSSK